MKKTSPKEVGEEYHVQVEKIGEDMVKNLGCNPCVTADTWVQTVDGPETRSEVPLASGRGAAGGRVGLEGEREGVARRDEQRQRLR